MKTRSRQVLGILLIAGPVTAFVVALAYFTEWRVVGTEGSEGSFATVFTGRIKLGWRLLLPMFVSAVGGLILLWRPSSKPPKFPR